MNLGFHLKLSFSLTTKTWPSSNWKKKFIHKFKSSRSAWLLVGAEIERWSEAKWQTNKSNTITGDCSQRQIFSSPLTTSFSHLRRSNNIVFAIYAECSDAPMRSCSGVMFATWEFSYSFCVCSSQEGRQRYHARSGDCFLKLHQRKLVKHKKIFTIAHDSRESIVCFKHSTYQFVSWASIDRKIRQNERLKQASKGGKTLLALHSHKLNFAYKIIHMRSTFASLNNFNVLIFDRIFMA